MQSYPNRRQSAESGDDGRRRAQSVSADETSERRCGKAPRLRVCMLAYTFYENDGRVMRYAEALAHAGASVDAIVLRSNSQPVEEVVNGIRVLRVQGRVRNEARKLDYVTRILRFFFRSMVEITRQYFHSPYDVIHVHSVPDFEVFAALVPKLRGAKIILDIHDIVPEFYAAKFRVDQESWAFKALLLAERLSTGFADHVIVANDLWFKKLSARSVRPEKCSAFINYPDPTLFKRGLRTRGADGKFILMYPGTLNRHQGLDIALKAFALASQDVSEMEFQIYGDGGAKEELQRLVKALGIGARVCFHAPVSLREIAPVMANADVALVPKRNDSFGGEAFSTKILEFMALGVPIIAADTRIDKYYFNETLLRFFRSGDEHDLARAIRAAYDNRGESMCLASNALDYVETMNWRVKKVEYLKLVEGLLKPRGK